MTIQEFIEKQREEDEKTAKDKEKNYKLFLAIQRFAADIEKIINEK